MKEWRLSSGRGGSPWDSRAKLIDLGMAILESTRTPSRSKKIARIALRSDTDDSSSALTRPPPAR
jgi:hypothetical protein